MRATSSAVAAPRGRSGHSSPALVMAHYAHAHAVEKAASAIALEGFCAGQS